MRRGPAAQSCQIGDSGVSRFERLRLHVLVLDRVMPGLTGLEVLARVQSFWPETRVVVLSMYDDQGHILRALQAGVMTYLLKESSARE